MVIAEVALNPLMISFDIECNLIPSRVSGQSPEWKNMTAELGRSNYYAGRRPQPGTERRNGQKTEMKKRRRRGCERVH